MGFSVQVQELAFDRSVDSLSIIREDREHGEIQVGSGNCLLIFYFLNEGENEGDIVGGLKRICKIDL